ncbi:hypothetical protein TGFOU_209755, partial [Toxoplasma gondii FOU]
MKLFFKLVLAGVSSIFAAQCLAGAVAARAGMPEITIREEEEELFPSLDDVLDTSPFPARLWMGPGEKQATESHTPATIPTAYKSTPGLSATVTGGEDGSAKIVGMDVAKKPVKVSVKKEEENKDVEANEDGWDYIVSKGVPGKIPATVMDEARKADVVADGEAKPAMREAQERRKPWETQEEKILVLPKVQRILALPKEEKKHVSTARGEEPFSSKEEERHVLLNGEERKPVVPRAGREQPAVPRQEEQKLVLQKTERKPVLPEEDQKPVLPETGAKHVLPEIATESTLTQKELTKPVETRQDMRGTAGSMDEKKPVLPGEGERHVLPKDETKPALTEEKRTKPVEPRKEMERPARPMEEEKPVLPGEGERHVS